MMATAINDLRTEITKLISAPYAVSLKRFHNILNQNESEKLIAQWADEWSDDIQPLASIVVEGLQFWPHTLDIIKRLSSVKDLRDAILLESPLLIDQLLEKATSTECQGEIYSDVCVAILAEPLPGGIAIPSSALTFVNKCFSRAVHDLKVETVEPVYRLLNGACAELLDTIPRHHLDAFGDHLTKLMRTVKISDKQLLNFLCLAIMARLKGQSCHPHTIRGTPSGTSVVCVPSTDAISRVIGGSDAAARLFMGDRAQKTMHLIVLQVIYACRLQDNGDPEYDARQIALARQVLAAVDEESRKIWAKTNYALVRKLHEKLSQQELTPQVRLEAFAFAAMLTELGDMSSSASLQLKTVLIKMPAPLHAGDSLQDSISLILPHILNTLNEDFWFEFLTKLLRGQFDSARAAKCFATVLTALTKCIPTHHAARGRLLSAVRTVSTQEVFGKQVAGNEYLQRGVYRLVLEAALYSRGADVTLDPSTAISLVNIIQASTVEVQGYNRPVMRRSHTSLGILERSGDTQIRDASRQWRQKLVSELELDSKQRHNSLIRHMSEVCQDLERRCENVEEPLREERLKFESLERDFITLKEKQEDMQAQLHEQEIRFEQLQEQKHCVDNELAEALNSIEELSQQKDMVEESLEFARTDAARILAATRSDFDAQKMDMRTTIACHVERLEDQEKEMSSLKRKLSVAEEEAQQEALKLTKHIADKDNTIKQIECTIDLERRESSCKDASLQELEIRYARLEDEAQRLQVKLTQAVAEIQELNQTHAAAQDAWSIEMQNLQSQQQRQIAQLTSEWTAARETLESQLSTKASEILEAHRTAAADEEARTRRYEQLQKTAQRYKQDSLAKAAELEELRAWRSNLMAAMGGGQGPAQAQAQLQNHTQTQAVAATDPFSLPTKPARPQVAQQRQRPQELSRRRSTRQPLPNHLDGSGGTQLSDFDDAEANLEMDLTIPSPSMSSYSSTSPPISPSPSPTRTSLRQEPPPTLPPPDATAPLSPPKTRRRHRHTTFRVPSMAQRPAAAMPAPTATPAPQTTRPLKLLRHSFTGAETATREPLVETSANIPPQTQSPKKRPERRKTEFMTARERKAAMSPDKGAAHTVEGGSSWKAMFSATAGAFSGLEHVRVQKDNLNLQGILNEHGGGGFGVDVEVFGTGDATRDEFDDGSTTVDF